jgi:hypothetical protein
MRRALVVLPAVALVLTACAPTSSPAASACCPRPDDATVTGVLVGVGGPGGASPQAWAGTISIHGTWSTTVDTDADGHFSLRLPHGRYRVTGTSPRYDDGHGACAALGKVRVRAQRTSYVRVVCQLR